MKHGAERQDEVLGAAVARRYLHGDALAGAHRRAGGQFEIPIHGVGDGVGRGGTVDAADPQARGGLGKRADDRFRLRVQQGRLAAIDGHANPSSIHPARILKGCAEDLPLGLRSLQRRLRHPQRGARFIDGAHASGFGFQHLFGAVERDLRDVDLHLRLQHAIVRQNLEIGEAQQFVESPPEQRRGLSRCGQGNDHVTGKPSHGGDGAAFDGDDLDPQSLLGFRLEREHHQIGFPGHRGGGGPRIGGAQHDGGGQQRENEEWFHA